MIDLKHLDGLARTRYVLDASTVSAATLAAMTTSASGAAAALGPLTTAGGQITLSTTSSASTVSVTFPQTWGNVGGSVAAWLFEVEGLRTVGKRGVVEVGFLAANGASTNGLTWGTTGFVLSSTATSAPATVQAGDFQDMTAGRAAVLVDVSAGPSSTATSTGVLGGTQVQQGPGVSASGTWTARIRVAGTTAAPTTSVSFRQAALTLVWRAQGSTLTRVL